VTLDAADVSALPASTTFVISVNGSHGALTLAASDVGALPDTAVAENQVALDGDDNYLAAGDGDDVCEAV
jgi:hypothetical protein